MSCFLNTCSLQYRLALSVSDANVNKDEITSKTRQALFLIAIFCGSAADLTSVRMESVSYPFLKDLGTERDAA